MNRSPRLGENGLENRKAIQNAVIEYAQSEKLKTGLIWIIQVVESAATLKVHENQNASSFIQILLRLATQETRIARRMIRTEEWDDIERHIDMAIVMVNSGVTSEASFHLTKALSGVTTLAERSMSLLKRHGLLP